jgi:plasmid stability protein
MEENKTRVLRVQNLLAEQLGIMSKIDTDVMKTDCRFLGCWTRKTLNRRVRALEMSKSMAAACREVLQWAMTGDKTQAEKAKKSLSAVLGQDYEVDFQDTAKRNIQALLLELDAETAES